MTFNLDFPRSDGELEELRLQPGETLFVLGANGTGKSTLMFRFNSQNLGRTKKISAHRQTWMNSDSLDMTPSAKLQTEQNIQNEDRNVQSRYRDVYAAQRASMTIYEIIDAENVRARAMASAYDAGDMDLLNEEAQVSAPIAVINELLGASNIPIEVAIKANERVVARKEGGAEYSAAELSDGERNALLIAGSVLTAPHGTLLIIDEPERHLHRSIISPLLGSLFARRRDCGFVISTHDHDLPLRQPGARSLLLRGCRFDRPGSQSWDADMLSSSAAVDESLKRDLLGSRRKVLFVEGTESSLDKAFYSLVFPGVSVVPKGGWDQVARAVTGARGVESLHWLRAFGLIDGDARDPEEADRLRERGLYCLPYYSIEALFFHPYIVEQIARRQAAVSGSDDAALAGAAVAEGLAAVREHAARLSRNAAKRAVRRSVMAQIPSDEELLRCGEVRIETEAGEILDGCVERLEAALAARDWEEVLTLCPVRASDALERIVRVLRFREMEDYLTAVRHLLAVESDSLAFLRSLFGGLTERVLEEPVGGAEGVAVPPD